jgi:hypothetical protein
MGPSDIEGIAIRLEDLRATMPDLDVRVDHGGRHVAVSRASGHSGSAAYEKDRKSSTTSTRAPPFVRREAHRYLGPQGAASGASAAARERRAAERIK